MDKEAIKWYNAGLEKAAQAVEFYAVSIFTPSLKYLAWVIRNKKK